MIGNGFGLFLATPNGQVTIAFDGAGLPYYIIPITLARGRSVSVRVLKTSRTTDAVRSSTLSLLRRKPISDFRVWRHTDLSRRRRTGATEARDALGRYKGRDWLMFQNGRVVPSLPCQSIPPYAPTIQYAIDRYTNEANAFTVVDQQRVGDVSLIWRGILNSRLATYLAQTQQSFYGQTSTISQILKRCWSSRLRRRTEGMCVDVRRPNAATERQGQMFDTLARNSTTRR